MRCRSVPQAEVAYDIVCSMKQALRRVLQKPCVTSRNGIAWPPRYRVPRSAVAVPRCRTTLYWHAFRRSIPAPRWCLLTGSMVSKCYIRKGANSSLSTISLSPGLLKGPDRPAELGELSARGKVALVLDLPGQANQIVLSAQVSAASADGKWKGGGVVHPAACLVNAFQWRAATGSGSRSVVAQTRRLSGLGRSHGRAGSRGVLLPRLAAVSNLSTWEGRSCRRGRCPHRPAAPADCPRCLCCRVLGGAGV
jgi:hypothetical protein